MKKYLLFTIFTCLGAFVLFTAFKKESAAVIKQNNEIQLAVEENLAVFTAEKEAQCKERALEVAMVRFDSIQTAGIVTTKSSSTKPKFPTTNKPKPIAPTNNTTPVTAAPPPAVDADPVPPPKPETNTGKKENDPAATGTNTGKKEEDSATKPSDPAKTEGVNKGKKKAGGNQ